ncbi:MAG: sensor histidine kinase, partial [Streptomycetales bacterium]
MGTLGTALAVVLVLAAAALVLWRVQRDRRDFGTPADRATFATLHTASLASPPLRAGLTAAGAQKAVRHLHALLGT